MSQRVRYPEVSPEGVAALRGVEHYCNAVSGLEPVLLELVRLRSSLLNGCEYCVAMHSHELEKHHEPEGRIAGVTDWETSAAYTERERAALRWAEVITRIGETHANDEEFVAVREHFEEKELVDLTLAIASINAWNRMAIAFRPEWKGASPKGEERSAVGDDGGKVAED